jgi:transposase
VDEDTIRRGVEQYRESGLGGLRNHAHWGGAHGQRELSGEQVTESQRGLREEARAGTKVGSGWTNKAGRQLITERFGVTYRKRGRRELVAHMGWSYQCGRKFYIRRDPVDQARYGLETREALATYARSGQPVVPLAGDQSKVYLGGTLSRRWDPRGQQPAVADGARSKRAENLSGAVHLGTGAEAAPFMDWLAR